MRPETREALLAAARERERQERLSALRDGRRQRSHKFRPGRGPGSYRRRPKHRRSENLHGPG